MKYRVWNVVRCMTDVDSDDSCRHLAVRSPMEGFEAIEKLRSEQSTDRSIVSSEFGLEVLSVDGWKEWYDDGGLDVLERFEAPVREREPVPV
jgi:hypothetical protein